MTVMTRWAGVSSGAEERLLEVRRAWIGVEKGFRGLLPWPSKMVVILDEVKVWGGQSEFPPAPGVFIWRFLLIWDG